MQARKPCIDTKRKWCRHYFMYYNSLFPVVAQQLGNPDLRHIWDRNDMMDRVPYI